MTESLQQVVRRQLLSAAAAGPATFEISGVLELPQPLEVYFMDQDDKPVCVSSRACPCTSPRSSGKSLDVVCCSRLSVQARLQSTYHNCSATARTLDS
jgi:hypothetical protein